MTLSDLGHDYTRYPIVCRKSSASYPSTPAPPYSGSLTPTGIPFVVEELKDRKSDANVYAGYITTHEKPTAWFLDDRLATSVFSGDGSHHFPLYMDEKEVDDDLHNPQPGDDTTLKPRLRELLSPRQLSSLIGLIVLVIGLLCILILLPVLSFGGEVNYAYPYDTGVPPVEIAEAWQYVNDIKYPLFQNIRTGLIDPHTPQSAMTRKSFDGEDLQLVFSDEFGTPNRTFYPGDDPFWTSPDIWYGATQDLEWYDPDAVTTGEGTLMIRLDQFVQHDLAYRSGMLNSWNQVCMKGGALEVSVSLPGPGGAAGLWPGIWTMGNLGRPGYKASTEGLWPYTYNSCDAGITPNQSSTDGISFLPGQRLPSCTCSGEDHPTPGTGRGAPEIDVFEGSADPSLHLGLITQSYQVAPYDIWYQPNYDHMTIPNFNTTQMNGYCGGPFQQAVSAQTELNNKWYDGIEYQTYGFEYSPGSLSKGKITWFVGKDVSFSMTGNAVGPNGNVQARPISEEPMSMVLNLGFSTAWTGINYNELKFPTTMRVDYVRWYQKPGEESVTCDPPGYETTDYIKRHPDAYHNANLTLWDQTGYGWPKHRLNHDC